MRYERNYLHFNFIETIEILLKPNIPFEIIISFFCIFLFCIFFSLGGLFLKESEKDVNYLHHKFY